MSVLTAPFAIACADIGTVREKEDKTSFGWQIVHSLSSDRKNEWSNGPGGNEIEEFVCTVADAIRDGRLALGFECPLWVPVAKEPTDLYRARCMDWVNLDGKRLSRSWSASAGVVSLSVGLTQVAWILRCVREKVGVPPPVFFNWEPFSKAERGVFLWEALVSGGSSSTPEGPGRHVADASRAVNKFVSCLGSDGTEDPTPNECAENCRKPNGKDEPNCKDKVKARSLIGAALLWAGWSSDVSLLHRKCIVLRTTKGAIHKVNLES